MRLIKLPGVFRRIFVITLITGSAMLQAADRAVDVENIIVTGSTYRNSDNRASKYDYNPGSDCDRTANRRQR